MYSRQSTGGGQSGRVLFIVLGVVAVLAVAAVLGLKFYGDYKAKKEVANVADDLRAQGMNMTYDSVDFSLTSLDVVISDVTMSAPTGGAYTMDRIVVSDYDLIHEVPQHMNIVFENMVLPVEEQFFGAQYRDLQEMGYETVICTMVMNFETDPDLPGFTLNEFTVMAQELCTLSMSVDLEQVTPEMIAFYLMDPSPITIRSASFTYEDHSLMERALATAARKQDQDPETLRAEAIASLDEPMAQAREEGSELGVAFFEALKKYLEHPGTLRLSANPPAPVTVGQIMQAEGDYALFDLLHVTTEIK